MQSNKKMSIEKYISIKENAYSFAKNLTKEKIIQFIKKIEMNDPEESLIYITTLLYPNDLNIINVFSQSMNVQQLCEKLNMHSKIIQIKAREYYDYKLPKLLKQNKILNQLCRQESKFSNDEITNEILDEKLK